MWYNHHMALNDTIQFTKPMALALLNADSTTFVIPAHFYGMTRKAMQGRGLVEPADAGKFGAWQLSSLGQTILSLVRHLVTEAAQQAHGYVIPQGEADAQSAHVLIKAGLASWGGHEKGGERWMLVSEEAHTLFGLEYRLATGEFRASTGGTWD